MIEDYRFGKIKISGKDYDYDVEVRWDHEVLKWWRQQSHFIDLEDLKRALERKPEMLIIGTGAAGIAKISQEAQAEIIRQGIELVIDKTGEAARVFNSVVKKNQGTAESKKVIGLFHLTC